MRILSIFLIVLLLAVPVSAAELILPEVPENARIYMPSGTENFGAGLMEVMRDAIQLFHPDLREAGKVCVGILAAVMLASVVRCISPGRKLITDLVVAALMACLLLDSTGAMIQLGTDTSAEIGEYGKLFLPVMTTALAAQGGITSSVAIYSGTVFFNTLLTNLISRIMNPLIRLYLVFSIGSAVLEEDMLKKIREVIKWLMTWSLKIILYAFTGFIGIAGVVTGTADAAALKVAKITISTMVPVVGGILSDASEAILVGAGTVKNAAGLYGMFAVIAITVAPFVKIGAHYLMLKGTAAVCHVFADKKSSELIGDFTTVLGYLLAMTGIGCLMLIISTACFLRGVN